MKQKQAKDNLYPWLLVSLAIAFSIQVAGALILDPIISYDSQEYLSISGNLFNGKGYAVGDTSFRGFRLFKGEAPTRMRQPGYPLYLVLFYWMLGEKIILLQFSQIVLNMLTLYLLFLIAHQGLGQRLWAGTLIGLALYFPFWLTSTFVMPEALFIFLLVVSMFLLQRAIYSEKNKACFVFTGIAFGTAFLTRPIILLLPFLSFLPIWSHMRLGKALLRWVVLLISFLAVLFLWFLRNAVVLGDYTPLSTDTGYGFWMSSIKEDEPRWSIYFSSPEFQLAAQGDYYHGRKAHSRFIDFAIRNIKADPFGYLARGIKRMVWVWSYFPGSQNYQRNTFIFGLFSLVQFLFLIFAVFGILTTSSMKTTVYYLLPAIALSCGVVFHIGYSRYIVPSMPFVLILSGQGFWLLIKRLFKIGPSQIE